MVRAVNTMNKVRSWQGPAILSYGFRPFFLLAGLWAALAMVLWIALLTGAIRLPTRFDLVTWHAHEFVFGYTSAVIAGFLLTAVPNWTGRLPVVGWPLAALALLWLAGRLAVACSAHLPPPWAAAIDLAHLAAMAIFLGREIITGRNWRSLPVLILLLLLIAANGVFHWQAYGDVAAGENVGLRLGIAVEVFLIALIGGRIIPSFTRNWLAARKSTRLPAGWSNFDKVTLALTAAALLSLVALPQAMATAALCLAAGITNLARLLRWQGQQTLSEPLLWSLHLAYAFLGLGFIALAAATLGLFDTAAALHIWLAGTVGLMTLAVMTRATRGHTGRQLTAPPSTALIYALAVVAVAARAAAALVADKLLFLYAASAAWIAAFVLFAAIYGPYLLTRTPKKTA
jgi:uncharacterized protein involved in response to NO